MSGAVSELALQVLAKRDIDVTHECAAVRRRLDLKTVGTFARVIVRLKRRKGPRRTDRIPSAAIRAGRELVKRR